MESDAEFLGSPQKEREKNWAGSSDWPGTWLWGYSGPMTVPGSVMSAPDVNRPSALPGGVDVFASDTSSVAQVADDGLLYRGSM